MATCLNEPKDRTLAVEACAHGLRVNLVSPAFVAGADSNENPDVVMY